MIGSDKNSFVCVRDCITFSIASSICHKKFVVESVSLENDTNKAFTRGALMRFFFWLTKRRCLLWLIVDFVFILAWFGLVANK